MDGVLRCSRYAFGPNRLHYCGPDANAEVSAYIQAGASDPGLFSILKQFHTMYPYLQMIAWANGIADPFHPRVVEAYWLGNNLLTGVSKQQLFLHLAERLRLKRRLKPAEFDLITKAISQGAVPHHNFHVFGVWRRTGHEKREHTLASLDACRVSWGKVKKVSGPVLIIETPPLILTEGKLSLGKPVVKKITRQLESYYDIEQIKAGELLSLHWGVPCEVITKKQAQILKQLTLKHLAIANQSL